jgi:hypothetical protein
MVGVVDLVGAAQAAYMVAEAEAEEVLLHQTRAAQVVKVLFVLFGVAQDTIPHPTL